MAMRLTRFTDPHAFYDRGEAFLAAREAENNLILGIAANLRLYPERAEPPVFLALVEDEARVQAAGVRTPPHHFVVSAAEAPEAIGLLVQAARQVYDRLPGVTGPTPHSLEFAQRWQAATGQGYTRGMAQRIYQLTAVRPPATVPGRMRPASQADRERMGRWYAAFISDSFGDNYPVDIDKLTDAWLSTSTRGLFFWETDEPVSMAGFTGPTPHGIRIGAVYTPPEHRRKGYASAVVAALSQRMLDEGRRYCFLFTDLANPTSNHIYQAIGYEPVCDVDEYVFGEPVQAGK
jgi:predicted GNAT family acetyltransferase